MHNTDELQLISSSFDYSFTLWDINNESIITKVKLNQYIKNPPRTFLCVNLNISINNIKDCSCYIIFFITPDDNNIYTLCLCILNNNIEYKYLLLKTECEVEELLDINISKDNKYFIVCYENQSMFLIYLINWDLIYDKISQFINNKKTNINVNETSILVENNADSNIMKLIYKSKEFKEWIVDVCFLSNNSILGCFIGKKKNTLFYCRIDV